MPAYAALVETVRRIAGGPSPRVARAYLRGLGAIYLIAFLSAWVQVHGLIGEQGILPARELAGDPSVLSFFQLWPSDGNLHLHMLVGCVSSVLLLMGFHGGLFVLLPWLCYLSLHNVGNIFFIYIWDRLLLEAGLLSIFLPDRFVAPRTYSIRPHWLGVLALRFLAFRLMFEMGCVKFTRSSDPAWQDGTFLTFFYPNQPMPSWGGWLLFQFPLWFHRLSVKFVFLSEVVLPLLIFGNRKMRLASFAGMSALQLFIFFTGNYSFFNLLSVVLFFLILDDRCLPWARDPATPASPPAGRRTFHRFGVAALGVHLALAVTLLISFLFLGHNEHMLRGRPLYGPLTPLMRAVVLRLHVNNLYVLFGHIPRQRIEIEIEGSADGIHFQSYGFRYKPYLPETPPVWYAPHHSRLDHQMFYEGVRLFYYPRFESREFVGAHWFAPFLRRLLEGSPSVTGLLANHPFAAAPPRFLRLRFTEMAFTDLKTLWHEGRWWQKRDADPKPQFVTRPFSLADVQLDTRR